VRAPSTWSAAVGPRSSPGRGAFAEPFALVSEDIAQLDDQDFSPATIKFIGITEILGAIGLILPWLTGIAPGPHPAGRPPD